MLIKCEACSKYVPKEFITRTENIFCESDDAVVDVCNECLKLKHFVDIDFQRELHSEWRKLVKEDKRNKKKKKDK